MESLSFPSAFLLDKRESALAMPKLHDVIWQLAGKSKGKSSIVGILCVGMKTQLTDQQNPRAATTQDELQCEYSRLYATCVQQVTGVLSCWWNPNVFKTECLIETAKWWELILVYDKLIIVRCLKIQFANICSFVPLKNSPALTTTVLGYWQF